MNQNKKHTDGIKVKAVKRETLPEKIISEIKSLIDLGQITPGSRLPSERVFARMLGVSRPSLREALKALSVLGIIVNKHGEGNFLSDDQNSWPNEPLSIFFSLKKGALVDIYEARKGMEMHAVALAAKRRTLEDLNEIKAALKQMRQAVDDRDQFFIYDNAFHLAITAATKNEIIIDLMGKIHKLSFETRNLLWKTANKVEVDTRFDLARHEELFELIAAGDAEAAAKNIGNHLDEILQRLKRGVVRGKSETEHHS